MTPAIRQLEKAGVDFTLHEFVHDPSVASFADEAAVALGVSTDRVFKTLVVALSGGKSDLAVAVLPASCKLDLKAAASAAGARKAAMAPVADAERATGYVHGGISPFAQKKRLPVLVDASATRQDTVFVSAGRRGLQVELTPSDLQRLSGGRFAAIAR